MGALASIDGTLICTTHLYNQKKHRFITQASLIQFGNSHAPKKCDEVCVAIKLNQIQHIPSQSPKRIARQCMDAHNERCTEMWWRNRVASHKLLLCICLPARNNERSGSWLAMLMQHERRHCHSVKHRRVKAVCSQRC